MSLHEDKDQSVEHGRTRQDLICAAFLMIPQVVLVIPHACLQGLIFGVHFHLLQIILRVQMPCSADWDKDIQPDGISIIGRYGLRFFCHIITKSMELLSSHYATNQTGH